MTAVWPGSSLHYIQVLSEGRWEDYSWKYRGNRYSHWHRGTSWIEKPQLDPLGLQERAWLLTANTVARPDSDLSYYLWKSAPIPETYLDKLDIQPLSSEPIFTKNEGKAAKKQVGDNVLSNGINGHVENGPEITIPV